MSRRKGLRSTSTFYSRVEFSHIASGVGLLWGRLGRSQFSRLSLIKHLFFLLSTWCNVNIQATNNVSCSVFLPAARPTGPRTVGVIVVVFQGSSLASSMALGILQFPYIIFFGLGRDPSLPDQFSLGVGSWAHSTYFSLGDEICSPWPDFSSGWDLWILSQNIFY